MFVFTVPTLRSSGDLQHAGDIQRAGSRPTGVDQEQTRHGGKPKGATAPKDRLLCGGFEGESPQHMGRFFPCYYLHDDRRQSHQLTDNVQQIKLLKLVQFSFIPKIISIQNEPMMPTLLQSRFKRRPDYSQHS